MSFSYFRVFSSHSGFLFSILFFLNFSIIRWSIIFIDGNHNGEYPLNDAISCAKYANEDSMIFFHDMVFPDVAKGLSFSFLCFSVRSFLFFLFFVSFSCLPLFQMLQKIFSFLCSLISLSLSSFFLFCKSPCFLFSVFVCFFSFFFSFFLSLFSFSFYSFLFYSFSFTLYSFLVSFDVVCLNWVLLPKKSSFH